jgi:hypothetical protein
MRKNVEAMEALSQQQMKQKEERGMAWVPLEQYFNGVIS